jgi:hypothetical protein
MLLNEVVGHFNVAAAELQKTEFRTAKTPGERQRIAEEIRVGDYAKLFDAVDPFIESFRTAAASDRALAASKLTPDATGVLLTFASAMPILAVRRESPELIMQGLTALAVLGSIDDIRDLTFYLVALHHAATKLHVNTRKVLADAAALAPSALLQDEMSAFPLRDPEQRDLAAFGFREVHTQEGFDLVQNSEWVRQDMTLFARLQRYFKRQP